MHSGIFTDDWDNQYDGADKHTDFYLHTLREYLTHFAPRPVTFAQLEGPEAAKAADAFTAVGRALGLADHTEQGARVRARGPEGQVLDAVVDFRNPYFLGLRSESALIRFFGRNHWGAPVGISVHDFAPDADAKATDDTTLVINFKLPSPRWNLYMAFGAGLGIYIVPKHVFSKVDDWSKFTFYDPDKGWPLSTTQWKVVHTSPQQKLIDRKDSPRDRLG